MMFYKDERRAVIFINKKLIRPPKRTNGSEDDQNIQKLETNRSKLFVTEQ